MRVINVSDLSVRLGGSDILQDISFSVSAGEFVCITGPNGAGKSTLLKAMLGILPVASGSVSFFGLSAGELRPGRVGYLPQKSAAVSPLFPANAEEVALAGIVAAKRFPKYASIADRKTAREALSLLGVDNLAARPFSELSGGQQQRVLLARALANRPELLLLDEPSTALDPESREEFFSLLQAINRSQGITVAIITHDMDYVGRYASTLLVLDRKVEYFGPAEAFLHKHHITHHHDYA